MIVKINGITVEHKGNPQLGRNAKEKREIGALTVVSTREERYEMYDRVDITNPSEQYLVKSDVISRKSSTDLQHDLVLVENIAYFDTILPASRAFKKVGQTLEDILLVYKRELSEYNNITIDYSLLSSAALNTVIPYKEFDGDNLSVILAQLFRKIWAIPKVTRDGTTWKIYAQYMNEKNNLISKVANKTTKQQNDITYGTKLKVSLKNAVNEKSETEVVWFPSENGYILPKADARQRIESKARYELDSEIITILKVEAVGISLTTQNINTSATTSYTNLDIDITSQVVQDEIWDLLPTTTSTTEAVIAETNNTKNNIRYKAGDKYITDLFEASTDKKFFTSDTNYLTNAIWRGFYLQEVIDPDIERANVFDFPNDIWDIPLRVKYVRRRNMSLIHNRKTKGNMNLSTTMHQQRDSSVESGEYLKVMKLYSNRMGNNTETKIKIFDIGDTPYSPFDYTDEKTIVVDVLNTYHANFISCEYETAENFADIEAEYALMQRNDPYTITAKSVTTNIIEEEYVEFSLSNKTDSTIFEDSAKRLLLGLFESTTLPYTRVHAGVFKPDLASWDSDHSIHMPVEVAHDGNMIAVHVQFTHPTVAAKTYYDLDTSSIENYLSPLFYTDDGVLANYELYFTSEVDFEDDGEYPLILDETAYLAAQLTVDGVQQPIDLDQSASFAKTLNISFITDNEKIYIGNALAKNNYFVANQNTTSAIDIYTSTKPYGQFDQAPRSYDTDNTLNVAYSYSFANKTITITPSIDIDYFSIVKDGEILLAINQSVSSGQTLTIYVNYLKESNVVYLEAFSVALSAFDGTATIAYTSRTYYLEALSGELATFEATATAAYTSRDYYLEALSAELSAFAGEATATYTTRDYALEAISDALSTFDGTASIAYTTRNYALEAKSSPLSTFNGTVTLGYFYFTAFSSPLSNFNGTAIISVPPSLVEWSIVSSGTVTGGTCKFVSDLGNIKEETSSVCSFVNDGGTYQSATDLTQSQPACNSSASYTVCFPNGDGTYTCQDRVGQVTQQTVKYECVYK